MKAKVKSGQCLAAAMASGGEVVYPRVSSKMTITQLKEEAQVRGHGVKSLPTRRLTSCTIWGTTASR